MVLGSSCMPIFGARKGKKEKENRVSVEVDTGVTFGSVESVLTQTTKRSKTSRRSSEATPFIEAHLVPASIFDVGRNGMKLQGDTLRSSAFVEMLFKEEEQFTPGELAPRLLTLGFSHDESEALAFIIRQFLATRASSAITRENMTAFLGFYFDKIDSSESFLDFGFELLDQNSDGSISQEELADFLFMFWNGKLENILKTQKGENHFRKFIEAQFAGENLEFYLEMRNVLRKPYIDLEKFEDIKSRYIAPGAPAEINISFDCRNEILNYEESEELKFGGLIKTKVLRDATCDVYNLLQPSVDGFSEEVKLSEVVACDIFAEIACDGEEMTMEDLQRFLASNIAIAEFVSDVRKLMVKARKMGEIEFRRQTSEIISEMVETEA